MEKEKKIEDQIQEQDKKIEQVETETEVEQTLEVSVNEVEEEQLDEEIIHQPQEEKIKTEEPIQNKKETKIHHLEGQKEGKKKIILPTVIVLVLSLILFMVYHFMKTNPKTLLVNSFTQLFNQFEYLYEPFEGNAKEVAQLGNQVTVNGNLKLDITSDVFTEEMLGNDYETVTKVVEKLNQLNLGYTYAYDLDKKRFLAEMNAELGEETLFGLKYLNLENEQYMRLGQLFDSYIHIAETYDMREALESNTQFDDFDYLMSKIEKSLLKHIKDTYITKEDTTITLNGKERNVRKISLELSDKIVNEIINNVANDLKKDKKANQILNELVPDFENFEMLDVEENSEEDPIYYSAYVTKGLSNIVGVEFGNKEATIAYVKNADDTIQIIENGNILGELVIERNKKGYTIEIKAGEKSIGTIALEKDKTVWKGTLKFQIEGIMISSFIDIDEIEKNKKETIDMELKMTAMGINFITIKANGTGELEKKADIEDQVSDVVELEDLTEEHFNQITENIEKMIQKFLS